MKKIISMIIVLSVALSSLVSHTFALETESSVVIPSYIHEELDIPLIAGYVEEVNAFDNIIGYENINGSKSLYIFNHAVKSVDEDGVVHINNSPQSISGNTAAFSDAVVYSNQPTTNYGSQTSIGIGEHESLGISRSFVKFNLNSLTNIVSPENIISARYTTIDLTHNYDVSTIEAFFVQSNWTSYSITWNNMPEYNANEKIATSTANYDVLGNPDFLQSFYITNAVTAWLQGLPNYGIMLKEYNDSYYKSLSSAENTSNVPYLVVTYNDDVVSEQTKGITSLSNYFLVNKNSGYLLTANSLISGDSTYQAFGSGSALQSLRLTYLNNGYYAILINDSTACLEVANSSTSNGSAVCVGGFTNALKQQWKIARNWDGSYRILSRLDSTKGICVENASTSSGASIQLYTHTSDFTKNDDWTLLPVQKGNASLFCFTRAGTGNIDTTSNMSNYEYFLDNDSFNATTYVNQSASVGLAKMIESSFFLFSGHGNAGLLAFYTSPTQPSLISTVNFSVPVENINDLSIDAFNNLQLAVLSSCVSGADYDFTNLVGQTYMMGAHSILSNTKSTSVAQCDDWLLKFNLSMSVGRTVAQSKEIADDYVYDEYNGNCGNALDRHDLGDQSYRTEYNAYNSTNARYSDDIFTNIETLSNKSTLSKEILVDGTKQSLNYISTSTQNVFGNTYDFYTDSNMGIYSFDSITNKLCSYTPNTTSLNLGNTVVDTQKALRYAQTFLSDAGYDISKFDCEHSNDYSKKFKIRYANYANGVKTSERIDVTIKSDEQGNLYVTDFSVHNYGLFSLQKTKTSSSKLNELTSKLDTLLLSGTKQSESKQLIDSYLHIDSNGVTCLRAVFSVNSQTQNNVEVIDIY